jgi:hypothetical protein
MSTGNEILDHIQKPPGLVIPTCWFHVPELRDEGGEPNDLAIIVLARLLRLRSEDVWDENIGGLRRGWEKLLVAAPAHRSFAELAKQVGFSVQEAEDVCQPLRSRGLITLEFRQIEQVSSSGENVLQNARFIGPFADKLADLFLRGSNQLEKFTSAGSAEDDTSIEAQQYKLRADCGKCNQLQCWPGPVLMRT